MTRASELAAEAASALGDVLDGSVDADVAAAVGVLAGVPSEVALLCGQLRRADDLTLAYLASLGLEATGASRPADHGVVEARVSGRWRGKTAAEHARDEGRTIGRMPEGRKKFPVREVRTLGELRSLFEALSRGGHPVDKPGYDGGVRAMSGRDDNRLSSEINHFNRPDN
jgi:hypothetical protein